MALLDTWIVVFCGITMTAVFALLALGLILWMKVNYHFAPRAPKEIEPGTQIETVNRLQRRVIAVNPENKNIF
jgi:hypothetical protein